MDQGPKLTTEQTDEIRGELIKEGVPVRFLHNGRNLSIVSGALQPKGINVMYQVVYWHFTRETANKIARWLGCRAVFSE